MNINIDANMIMKHRKRCDWSRKEIRELKTLHLKIFDDPLRMKILTSDDLIFAIKDETQYYGMAAVKYGSPFRHFKNESKAPNKIPYLIDFGVLPEYRQNKIGGKLLSYVKDTLYALDEKYLNLDIIVDDNTKKVMKFYINNKFSYVGKFDHPNKNRFMSMECDLKFNDECKLPEFLCENW